MLEPDMRQFRVLEQCGRMLDLRKRLHPTDYQLYAGIKILNAETDAVGAYLCEGSCEFACHSSGVEAGVYNLGDLFEKFPWQQVRRAIAPMNVFHRASWSESFQCEPQFRHERLA
jgi:hypothetical protein